MIAKLAVATCLVALASGCVSPDYVSAREMAYAECNEKTSIERGGDHTRGPSATELGQEVEQKCRREARIDVSLENQLLNSLENAIRIENVPVTHAVGDYFAQDIVAPVQQ